MSVLMSGVEQVADIDIRKIGSHHNDNGCTEEGR
jgi:hypothetical protein